MKTDTVVLVNIVKTEPAKQAAAIELLEASTRNIISTLRGWLSTRLVASGDGASIIIYSEWETQEDIAAMRADPRMMAWFPRIREHATFESVQGRLILSEAR